MKAFFLHIQSNKKIRVKGEMTIGRVDCDKTFPDDARMSRKHCVIRQIDSLLTLEDLDSKNGILLNNELIPPHIEIPLKAGAIVIVGDQEFQVIIEGIEEQRTEDHPEGLLLPASQGDDLTSNREATSQMTNPSPSEEPSPSMLLSPELDKTIPDGKTHLYQFGEEGFTGDISKNWETSKEIKSSSFITSASLPNFDESSTVPTDFFEHDKQLNLTTPLSEKSESVNLEAVLSAPEAMKGERELNSPDDDSHLADARTRKERETKGNAKSATHSREIDQQSPLSENANDSRLGAQTTGKNEEIVFMRTTRPGLWRGFLLGFILPLPVPIIYLLQGRNFFLLSQIKEPQTIAVWLSACLVPALLLVGPLQAIRMRTGWSRGVKSLLLSLAGMGLISSLQFFGINAIEKFTGFSERRMTSEIQQICIDRYRPDQCAKTIFTCPTCLKKFSFSDREALLKSMYPFIEELTRQSNPANRDSRRPSSNHQVISSSPTALGKKSVSQPKEGEIKK